MKSNKLPHVANLLFPSSVEDLFNQFWREPNATCGTQSWTPRIDVKETASAYVVEAELPGVDPKSVEVTVTGDSLTLSGSKAKATTSSTEGAAVAGEAAESTETAGSPGPSQDQGSPANHQRERQFGTFARTFTFPTAVSTDAVDATSRHGVLTIVVSKAAASQTRRVEIRDI